MSKPALKDALRSTLCVLAAFLWRRVLKFLASLILILSLFGCSTIASVPLTKVSSPPEACLADCKNIPEVGTDPRQWMHNMVQQYAECAILHTQCQTALIERMK